MKRRILALMLVLATTASLVACGGKATTETEATAETETAEAEKEELETDTIKWNCGVSGNVLLTIAEDKGYFKEAGLNIEYVSASAAGDMMSLLSSGKVDVVSNAGTNNPLQQIASGVDLTIIGGHMVTGCMPIIAKTGTKWNGIEDFIGKKVAALPSYYALTGPLLDMGYDPLNDVEWLTIPDFKDALTAVARGEVDYAILGTQQNQIIEQTPEVEVMCYQSDVTPNYSCCRMAARTEWVNENPTTVKVLLKTLLRAQAYYENNKEEAVKLHAKNIGADEDFVSIFMMNDHYNVNVDTLLNPILRAWDILDKTGFLDANAANIDIASHVGVDMYEEALNEAAEEFGDEYPDFWTKQKEFFKENNK